MSNFKKGDAVEVTKNNNNNNEGNFFYYPATVIRLPSKNNNNQLFVEYLTLSDPSSKSNKHLKEYVNVVNVRPKPPDQVIQWFKVGDSVDAYRYSVNAWCPASVIDIRENSTYLVEFRGSNPNSEIVHQCSLRLHREWLHRDCVWVPPLLPQQQEVPPKMVLEPKDISLKIKHNRTPLNESNFKKSTIVEVSSDDEGYKGAWFVATIVDKIGKDRFLVEYRDMLTDNGTHLLKEEVDARFIRPCPPEAPAVTSFEKFQEVDAWYNDAWWQGMVLELLNSKECLVRFMHNDALKVKISQLRPHQDWLKGKWVMSSKEVPPKRVAEPEDISLKIKQSKKPLKESKFKKGTTVEFSSDDEGYKGAWFVATIVDKIGKDRFLVECRDMLTDDGTQLLKEEVDARFIRPCPPEAPVVTSFEQFQEVDAWYNDAWWQGVVLELLNSKECLVRFMHNDALKVKISQLRPHQDWLNGKWVMSSKTIQVMPKANNLTRIKLTLKRHKPSEHAKNPEDETMSTTNTRSKFVVHFCKGAKVEVRSDEEGYLGAWFTATVVDFLWNGKYLVEYLTLKTNDLTEQLKEEADASDIRPYPPDIDHTHLFVLHEWVDAWYNDGWWVGQVSRVLSGLKYMVYFLPTNEKLEFDHCHLRPHQEWIDGRWVLPSLGKT